jgi:hypothetical protein
MGKPMPENPNTLYETAVLITEDEETEIELGTLKTRDNFETYFTDDELILEIESLTQSEFVGDVFWGTENSLFETELVAITVVLDYFLEFF